MGVLNKKGASVIISYVLVIGLSVTLAVAIGLWTRGESKKVVETTVQEAEAEIKCVDVFFNVLVSDEEGTDIEVKNTGSFTITGFRYICYNVADSVLSGRIDESLGPSSGWKTLSIEHSCVLDKEVTLTPFIEIKGKEFICPEKKKVIK